MHPPKTPRHHVLARLALVAAAFVAVACSSTSPTEPAAANRPTIRAKGPALNDGRIPCDSTVVVDGTCHNGWINPHG